ncbi:hypothetical protein EVC10_058 [Rhizobium phage RHph_Y25]|nr:hypothetical protein EVC10_058 [Rhizobium phage RHph_Y25]
MHRDQFSLDDDGSATSLSPSSNAREQALPPSIGSLAVRIVGRFKRPRIVLMLGPSWEGDDPSAR